MKETLTDYGYERFFAPEADRAHTGRVIAAYQNLARVIADAGEMECPYAPGLQEPGRYGGACAGDWVRLEEIPGGARIREILPRKTHIARRAAGPVNHEQLIAANVDLALIITSMNADFNPARLGRYLAAVAPGGAAPVIVLTKADLCADAQGMLTRARAAAPGADVLAVSAVTGAGMEALRARMAGKTSALVGMSGVGKSSAVNYLAGGARMKVNDIRAGDARGRHTTTHREMLCLPGGIVVIDTPGMREMGLWEAGGVKNAYADVLALAQRCRFRDCRHEKEPGCAVMEAVRAGKLDAKRLRGFQTLQTEETRALARARAPQKGKKPRPSPARAEE